PRIIKINKAVHSTKKRMKIYKISERKKYKYPDWVKGIASIDINHHKKTHISKEDIEEECVCSDNFMNIISKSYSGKTIDFIQIDTEGYDAEVLKMLNFRLLR